MLVLACSFVVYLVDPKCTFTLGIPNTRSLGLYLTKNDQLEKIKVLGSLVYSRKNAWLSENLKTGPIYVQNFEKLASSFMF